MDVRLPPGYTEEGLRAAVELRRRHPELPVLVVSQHITVTHLDRLLADGRGGIGYLLKDRVTGFSRPDRGGGPGARRGHGAGSRGDRGAAGAAPARTRCDTLTPRERQVLVAGRRGPDQRGDRRTSSG